MPVQLKALCPIHTLIAILFIQCNPADTSSDFHSNFSNHQRVWIGPEYWANPMQDWRVADNRLECVSSGGNRNVFLLTHELSSNDGGDFQTQITLGSLVDSLSDGWVGFKIGVKGEFNDYRDNAVRGEGLPLGITGKGQVFIGSMDSAAPYVDINVPAITLSVNAHPADDQGYYTVNCQVQSENGELVASYGKKIRAHWLEGGLALVCSAQRPPEVDEEREYIEYPWGSSPDTRRGGNFRFWFADWKVSGSKLNHHPDRVYGPVLFTQFTVSHSNLKLTAQFPPISSEDPRQAILQFKGASNQWTSVDTSNIHPLSRTALFECPVDTSDSTNYRVYYQWSESADLPHFEGIIPAEPSGQEPFIVAAFTGNNDLGFPNNDLTHSVSLQNPHFLFFSGDQIYERVGGYGIETTPLDRATIDYLRKWYLFGWTFRDLMRRTPSVAIPDDHDVYHGNIWGEGGKKADSVGSNYERQDSGGYKMVPEWVNMVQRTQTSHLPDPYDPTEVQQGIGVYYTNLEYAGISFAILEDRKFKYAPKALLPDARIENGWAQNPSFDAVSQADHPEAKLLGSRQLDFLEWWTGHWEKDTWMKVVLSQTIFANVATLPRENSHHDNIVPELRILEAGEYAPDDVVVSDMDSNGWPQSGRDQALRIIRKAFALHIAGDQHLGSTIQYGIDDYGDAGYAICVPSVSNVWPRRWYPPKNPETGTYTGNYRDGFGNLITVKAVSNPVYTGRKPSGLYDRATGYGIVKLQRIDRQIILENWPRDAEPGKSQPYPGWPVVINQLDNFNPAQGAYLPEILARNNTSPLIKVLDPDQLLVLALRIAPGSTTLKVIKPGPYTIRVVSDLGEITDHPVSAVPDPWNRGSLNLAM